MRFLVYILLTCKSYFHTALTERLLRGKKLHSAQKMRTAYGAKNNTLIRTRSIKHFIRWLVHLGLAWIETLCFY